MTLTKNKVIREIGRRTRLKNREVQLMLEALIEVWIEELIAGGRIELENLFVLEKNKSSASECFLRSASVVELWALVTRGKRRSVSKVNVMLRFMVVVFLTCLLVLALPRIVSCLFLLFIHFLEILQPFDIHFTSDPRDLFQIDFPENTHHHELLITTNDHDHF